MPGQKTFLHKILNSMSVARTQIPFEMKIKEGIASPHRNKIRNYYHESLGKSGNACPIKITCVRSEQNWNANIIKDKT